MASQTDPKILEQVRFLGEIVNYPDFSPEFLYLIWECTKKSDWTFQVEAIKEDLNLLRAIEKAVGQNLARAKSDLLKNNNGIMRVVNIMQHLLGDGLQEWEDMMGCSTDDFSLRVAMAKTRHHLRKTVGLKAVDACIWTAASAVHLGEVPPVKFGLSGVTDFKKLNADKSANNRVRKKLAERVGRTCDRYINRLGEMRDSQESLASKIIDAQLDAKFEADNLDRLKAGLPALLPNHYIAARRKFIAGECKYFGLKK